MNEATIKSMEILSCCYCFVLIFSILAQQSRSSAVLHGNETDRLSLLAFKDTVVDNNGALQSWNESLHFCRWQGITCGNNSRAMGLRLPSLGLAGSLPPHLGNLTYLKELSLGGNSLRGDIPPELGKLRELRSLNLSVNLFHGSIPANLSHCRELENLVLGENQLVGQIPSELTSSLSKLRLIQLQVNYLSGVIPPSLGNLSSLTSLSLGRNSLVGVIPDGIGRLARLDFLQIAENQLSGWIPESLYNLTSITFITMAGNLRLQGSLPPDLGRSFPKLETFYMGDNRLTGAIPASIVNASMIANLDLAYNNFSGFVPADIGRLSRLNWLNFESNQLGKYYDANGLAFVDSLSNCSNLEVLDIDSNRFGGAVPNSVANLSNQLSMLIMGGNRIRGEIPEGIGNLAGLTVLRMEQNLLTGGIPPSVGRLRNLQLLSLSGNNLLSGQLPYSLGNLTGLNDLWLGDNRIQGSIPPSLGNCTSLQLLELSRNRLSGSIPPQVIGISSLSVLLNLAQNSLAGSLPEEVGNLTNLKELDISGNRLSDEIPQALGNCKSLEYLHMQGNMFRGGIPSSLSRLKGVVYIDLSSNNLTGPIPGFLGTLKSLKHLNLSSNRLEGVVPREGVFTNASAVSVLGNGGLCGGAPVLQLPSCPAQTNSDEVRGGNRVIQIVVPIVCVVTILVVLLSCLYAARRRKRASEEPPPANSEPTMIVSYRELYEATSGFSSTNLIGEGSYGTVYKGTLRKSGTTVAVKVLDLKHRGASKSFLAECEALGRQVRHRNLIKIVTSCSSVDFSGNDFKALVYEFMPNGSLDEWLHEGTSQEANSKVLNISQRLNISIDVASALDYLHHHCHVPIAHCDLKPSNILLDNDMNAHVSDFGLAKILFEDESSSIQSNSIAIKGSIGYVPPEYGMGVAVSTDGDVYSYGILLLEIFTGRRPTDDSLSEGLSLHDVVRIAFPEQVMAIADPQMLSLQKGDEMSDMNRVRECLGPVIGIGLSCSASLPRDRMKMGDVVGKLHDIRSRFISRKGGFQA